MLLAVIAGTWLVIGWLRKALRKGDASPMNRSMKIAIVAILAIAVVVVLVAKERGSGLEATVLQSDTGAVGQQVTAGRPEDLTGKGRPTLIDLGAGKCIPCKMMAPILDGLKEEYKGRMEVVFIDVLENPNAGAEYGIELIPTQIFFDATGKELFRHEGFFSKEDILATWKKLGVDLSDSSSAVPAFEQLTPARPDERPKESVCYMCDGDIEARTLVTVQTDKGPVRMCGPHCYFIMYSSLTEDKTGFERRVNVTDWTTGQPVPIVEAAFLSGEDETIGRPWIKAFAGGDAALAERSAAGGSVLNLESLARKEMSHRCGFCDRACYPQDASEVIVEGGMHTWGCCSHCALGVAARTGKDIEVREKDRLTKQPIIVKTFEGKVASLEPATAVAWFGQRQKPDGTWASAGCFHQGFFTSADNLKKWVAQNPYETGRLISISQALADKMKLTPAQIQNACKIGECAPK